MEMRLQKFLADAGIASRRKAEELILAGKVIVNGKVTCELGVKVNPDKDKVFFNGELVKIENDKVYILMNKPKGYISAAKDQFDNPSVLNLLKNVDKRVFPVGRLDKDTTGALLLTNDGDFAYMVTHPKHEIEKTYIAKVWGRPTSAEMSLFMKGIKIDGKKTYPAKIRIVEEKGKVSIVEIKIHEGRNRQVKKMCESIGHKVIELHREAIGELDVSDLKVGTFRYVKFSELKSKLKV